ncbi:hypothetical protein [Lichenibacterium dinghuense]|uniref:hypothetical protein n=1 Tax=Lichenibacterium dinghuense TaxID=2895977 RepID=UPI001F4388C7|nr:hypothetical protein [Lichenibacterium sp. 6Y81]
MPSIQPQTRRHFTDAARAAAAAARKAKREGPDRFGQPEMFVVKAGERAFTWELRRFGGVVLQRGPEGFRDTASARADGEAALTDMCASPNLPRFKRDRSPHKDPSV